MGSLRRGREDPATLATHLLSACVFLEEDSDPVGMGFARALTVGDREALLLQLRAWSVGETFVCVLDCPACAEPMELELRASDLLLDPYEHRGPHHELRVECGREDGTQLRFRLPNGGDQEAVASVARTDPDLAARAIADRCLLSVDGETPPRAEALSSTDLESLSRRMADLDPQAEMLVLLTCPNCGEECHTIFDSVRYLQAELDRAQSRMDWEIHLLAYHYHWSESEILGMPGARRRRYAEYLSDALRTGGAP